MKSGKVSSDDQPFINEKLKKKKRKKCREYRKSRKSKKWTNMEEIYQNEVLKAKKSFYRKKISNLRKTNPRKS